METTALEPSPFSPFPILTTPRLVLRAITLDDAPALFAIHGDARVKRYTGSHPDRTIEEIEQRIHRIIDAVERGEGIRWAITLGESGALVGSCGFWRWARAHFRAEIGYELAPAHWGRGYMVEALAPILDWGFRGGVMGLHSVEANVDPDNAASVRVLERLGFLKEGHIRENFFFDGKFYDTGLYSLLAPGK